MSVLSNLWIIFLWLCIGAAAFLAVDGVIILVIGACGLIT